MICQQKTLDIWDTCNQTIVTKITVQNGLENFKFVFVNFSQFLEPFSFQKDL